MPVPIELLIIGTGGMAREAAQLARQIDPNATRWSRISFVAENASELGSSFIHGEVRFTDAHLRAWTDPTDVVIGIGHPQVRRTIAYQLSTAGFGFPNLIHPSVEIDNRCVSIGQGNIVTKGVVMTCDIQIGDFNIFNWNSTIGHDVSIGSYNVINPGCNVSGCVVISDACLIGTGTQVLERRTIARDIVIGAGAVVTRSLIIPGTYVGVPAKLTSC